MLSLLSVSYSGEQTKHGEKTGGGDPEEGIEKPFGKWGRW
jgi:hypothetical protein